MNEETKNEAPDMVELTDKDRELAERMPMDKEGL